LRDVTTDNVDARKAASTPRNLREFAGFRGMSTFGTGCQNLERETLSPLSLRIGRQGVHDQGAGIAGRDLVEIVQPGIGHRRAAQRRFDETAAAG
jgi:hypothetical protein